MKARKRRRAPLLPSLSLSLSLSSPDSGGRFRLRGICCIVDEEKRAGSLINAIGHLETSLEIWLRWNTSRSVEILGHVSCIGH